MIKLHRIFKIVIGSENFGCVFLYMRLLLCAQAGLKAVIAPHARIFFRNSVDGGFYPPIESQKTLSAVIRTGEDLEIVTLESEDNYTTGKRIALNPCRYY